MRISGKLTLGMIASIVAILAASSYLTVNREVQLFETDMTRDHEIFAKAVGSSMARVWRVDGRSHAMGLLEQLDAGPGAVRVRFIPKDGTPNDPHIDQTALRSVRQGGQSCMTSSKGRSRSCTATRPFTSGMNCPACSRFPSHSSRAMPTFVRRCCEQVSRRCA